jgi:tetratricopeptide (TPR) repeat protein
MADLEKLFSRFPSEGGFLKTTVRRPALDGSAKAALNRKGNLLFNDGKIEEARRVFLTTGYSDGLVRVGDYYKAHGRIAEALNMYRIAPDLTKAGQIEQQMVLYIKKLIHENERKNQ